MCVILFSNQHFPKWYWLIMGFVWFNVCSVFGQVMRYSNAISGWWTERFCILRFYGVEIGRQCTQLWPAAAVAIDMDDFILFGDCCTYHGLIYFYFRDNSINIQTRKLFLLHIIFHFVCPARNFVFFGYFSMVEKFRSYRQITYYCSTTIDASQIHSIIEIQNWICVNWSEL